MVTLCYLVYHISFQAYIHDFIASCKDDVFDDGADILMERLTKAAKSVGEALVASFEELAQKVCFLCVISENLVPTLS